MTEAPPENIVRLADFRITRREGARPGKLQPCQHHSLVIDRAEGTLECGDCGKSVNPFLVLAQLADDRARYQEEVSRLLSRAAAMRRVLATYKPHLRAAKNLEHTWRGGRMRPCCPNCGMGLRAEDFANGTGAIRSIDYDDAVRRRNAKPPAS